MKATTATRLRRCWYAAASWQPPTAARSSSAPERGDVPGWVLITLMTAGLVTALWAVADDQLRAMFQSALSSVTGP
jgi:hypothetical protein